MGQTSHLTFMYSTNVTKLIIKSMRNTLLSSSDTKVCTKCYIKTVPPEKGQHCIVCETNWFFENILGSGLGSISRSQQKKAESKGESLRLENWRWSNTKIDIDTNTRTNTNTRTKTNTRAKRHREGSTDTHYQLP